MIRLILLRHGQAASLDGVPDLDRPLTGEGRAEGRRMGRYLADEGFVPDLALVSPARRARETWAAAEAALAGTAMRAEPRLYDAAADRLLALVREVEPSVGTLLLVAHNPGMAELAQLLLADADRYAHCAALGRYPTGGLAVVEGPADAWHELSPRSGRLLRFVTPQSLGREEPS